MCPFAIDASCALRRWQPRRSLALHCLRLNDVGGRSNSLALGLVYTAGWLQGCCHLHQPSANVQADKRVKDAAACAERDGN
jgi:hypothetical protein